MEQVEQETDDILLIDRQNVFDQSVKSDMRTYDNIRKVATGRGDDYITGCLLDYPDFKGHYKMITTQETVKVLYCNFTLL